MSTTGIPMGPNKVNSQNIRGALKLLLEFFEFYPCLDKKRDADIGYNWVEGDYAQ